MNAMKSTAATTDMEERKVNNKTVVLHREYIAHLAREAKAEGISFAEAYGNELEAASRIAEMGLTNAQMVERSKQFQPPQSWLDDDEEDLF